MVLACWPWLVKKGDCGQIDDIRNPATCHWGVDRAICSACYGVKSIDGEWVQLPAGLIAAQSIGERGTQLSMQSFHAAQQAISIDKVLAVFDGKDTPEPGSTKNWFTSTEDAAGFIARIKAGRI